MTGHSPNDPGEAVSPRPAPLVTPQPQSATPSGYAIAAFVLGILSFVTCGPCAGLPAFIFGLIELRNIRDKASPIEGKAFALAGTILGGISTALAMLVILFYGGIIVIFVLAQALFGLE